MLWQKSAFSGGSIFGGGGKVHMEQWRLHKTLRGHDGDVLDLAWGENINLTKFLQFNDDCFNNFQD